MKQYQSCFSTSYATQWMIDRETKECDDDNGRAQFFFHLFSQYKRRHKNGFIIRDFCESAFDRMSVPEKVWSEYQTWVLSPVFFSCSSIASVYIHRSELTNRTIFEKCYIIKLMHSMDNTSFFWANLGKCGRNCVAANLRFFVDVWNGIWNR